MDKDRKEARNLAFAAFACWFGLPNESRIDNDAMDVFEFEGLVGQAADDYRSLPGKAWDYLKRAFPATEDTTSVLKFSPRALKRVSVLLEKVERLVPPDLLSRIKQRLGMNSADRRREMDKMWEAV